MSIAIASRTYRGPIEVAGAVALYAVYEVVRGFGRFVEIRRPSTSVIPGAPVGHELTTKARSGNAPGVDARQERLTA